MKMMKKGKCGLQLATVFTVLVFSAVAETVTLEAVADLYLAGGGSVSNSNYGGAPTLLIGKHPTLGNFHGLLRFDLSGLDSHRIINKVTLKLDKPAAGVGAAFAVNVYELSTANSNWVEGTKSGATEPGSATWAHRGTSAWAGSAGASSAGADYISTLLASYNGSLAAGEAVFVSREAFKTAVVNHSGGVLNLGLGLDADRSGQYYRFSTRESGAPPARLIIEYYTAGAAAGPTVSVTSRPETEPSDGQQLTNKTSSHSYDQAFDLARKASLEPDELAWEVILEQHLGPFYLPPYKKAKEKGTATAWDYVKDDPALPRVLIIGDSISRGYTLPVRYLLNGKANVHRAPCNCGPTSKGLRDLDIWLGTGTWDLIFFNFGIHDRANPETYSANLEQIIPRLQATGARLIFAATTPLPPGEGMYRFEDGVRLNDIAVPMMARYGIPVCDLYTTLLPVLEQYQNPGDCHFNTAGYQFIGELAATAILAELKK